jgi:hypothetical protein
LRDTFELFQVASTVFEQLAQVMPVIGKVICFLGMVIFILCG